MKIMKYFVYILLAISFTLLFISPFGPIKMSTPIPSVWHPIGWAGSFVYFAMVLAFSRAFYETKDAFWLVLIVGFFPLLISDQYFFPYMSKIFGWGMLMWAAVHLSILSLGLFFYGKVPLIRYSNLIIFLISLLTIPAALSGKPIGAIGFIGLFIIAYSLAYYGLKQGNYLFVLGAIINLIANGIVLYTFITGTNTLFSGVITDRIAVFGRILMVLGVMTLNSYQKKFTLSRH